RHRPHVSGRAPAAHVRGPLDGLGRARHRGSGACRICRRSRRMAVGLPGLLPLVLVAGSLALRELRSVPGNPHRVARRVLLDAVRVASGTGLALAGLQARDVVLSPALLAIGLGLGIPALRKLLPAGTFRANGALPAAVLSRGILTFAFFAADVFVPLTVTTIRG